MATLITGSCGYIGSHVVKRLMEHYPLVGIDNYHTGLKSNDHIMSKVVDIRSTEALEEVFRENKIDTVIHLAALTSVPESMENKDEYYDVNTEGTSNLLLLMKKYGCNRLIFSSTASIYKQSKEPLKETDPIQPLNNYALTKYWAEQLIKNCDWLNYIIFRYFNVIGYSGWFDIQREMYKTNLVPALLRTAKYNHPFKVFGNGYPVTREDKHDHTCVRDYIDVRDIANAHRKAMIYLNQHEHCREIFNLGTKNGSSVLELIKAFEEANKVSISYTIEKPRKGDPASLIANNRKAIEILAWTPEYSLVESLTIPTEEV